MSVTELGLTNGKNRMTFSGDLVTATDLKSLFHSCHHSGIAIVGSEISFSYSWWSERSDDPTALKSHFFADCSSANILNIVVYEIKLIK